MIAHCASARRRVAARVIVASMSLGEKLNLLHELHGRDALSSEEFARAEAKLFCVGAGLVVYVLMWIFVPLEQAGQKARP